MSVHLHTCEGVSKAIAFMFIICLREVLCGNYADDTNLVRFIGPGHF